MVSEASFHPMYSSINAPDKITEDGFTLSKPAYFGAVPWVASKIACQVLKLIFAPGAIPIPPTEAAAASDI